MVCNPEIFGYIKGDSIMLEKEPLVNLSKDGQLMAYRHEGFWQCMDTKREMEKLCILQFLDNTLYSWNSKF